MLESWVCLQWEVLWYATRIVWSKDRGGKKARVIVDMCLHFFCHSSNQQWQQILKWLAQKLFTSRLSELTLGHLSQPDWAWTSPFRYDNFRFAAEALKVKEQAGHQYCVGMSFVLAFFSLADRDWSSYIPLTSHGCWIDVLQRVIYCFTGFPISLLVW